MDYSKKELEHLIGKYKEQILFAECTIKNAEDTIKNANERLKELEKSLENWIELWTI